jgi:hypothetical protein
MTIKMGRSHSFFRVRKKAHSSARNDKPASLQYIRGNPSAAGPGGSRGIQ